MLKILFMGTPDFAMESLKELYENNFNIIGVVTNIDKNQGRGMKLTYSPVKEYALEKKLPLYQPAKIKNNIEFIEKIKELSPDLICVVAYGKILPKEILEIPKYGCVNVHASLLPKYRGAAPIQWAILNGDKETGITTMYMDAGMDTGDMILKKEVTIDDNETTGELWNRLSKIGAKLLVETINKIITNNVTRQKQGENFTMAPMLEKEIAKINWEYKTAIEIKNLVRGLNPILGAYSYVNGKKIKFWKVNILEKENLLNKFSELVEVEKELDRIIPGTVILSDPKNGLYIKAKNGYLEILEIQPENSKKLNIYDFLRGNKIDVGTIFE